jgi:hypothetical protein
LAPTARAHGWARYIKTSIDNQTKRLGETNVFKLLDTITQLFHLLRTKSRTLGRLQEFALKTTQEIAAGEFFEVNFNQQ